MMLCKSAGAQNINSSTDIKNRYFNLREHCGISIIFDYQSIRAPPTSAMRSTTVHVQVAGLQGMEPEVREASLTMVLCCCSITDIKQERFALEVQNSSDTERVYPRTSTPGQMLAHYSLHDDTLFLL